jgi:uncharacterized membrane protein SpoIIM required for sporulation
MLTNLWMDTRKDNWNRLDALLRQSETGGVRRMSPADLRELGLLYRQAAADLSAARADPASRSLAQYLNRLVGRAHNVVYSGKRITPASLFRFFAHGYPRLLRRMSGYLWTATLVFLLAGLLGALITALRPDFASMMLGARMMDSINQHHMWTESILSAKPQASSAIMTNNITVCFYTFIGGITAGLITLFLLFNNGLQIGVVLTCCHQHGMMLSLVTFMAAHGALEIPSIMIAGAAGLRLGSGILFPGFLRRKDALAAAGADAVQLIAGTIPLLIVAGTLEAFLSPTHAPSAIKFATCALLFAALVYWLTEGGRRTVSSE